MDLAALGATVRRLRLARGHTLDSLSAAAGVSRAMLSAVERGDKAPTVLTLDRIATGLGTTVSRLLGDEHPGADVTVLRHAEQDVARDPGGWERRVLSPVLPGVEFEFMRTTLGPGVDAGEFPAHASGSREYVAVERGTLLLTVGGAEHRLAAGDAAAYPADRTHAFVNPDAEDCVFYLVMSIASGRAQHAQSRGGAR